MTNLEEFKGLLDTEIELAIENLRDVVKDMSILEICQAASNEHIWALCSDTTWEATLHEVYADAYRILAQEKRTHIS